MNLWGWNLLQKTHQEGTTLSIWLSKHVCETKSTEYCDSKGLEPKAGRELPSKRPDMKSYHVIFPLSKEELVQPSETWPENIILRRYFSMMKLKPGFSPWIRILDWRETLKIGLQNVHSFAIKTKDVNAFIGLHEFHLFAVTETWFCDTLPHHSALCCFHNYLFIGAKKPARGGGIGFFYHITMSTTILK